MSPYFKQNNTGGNVTDGFINLFKIQHKSTNFQRGKFFLMSVCKTKNSIICPYEQSDNIDYFVFEILTYPMDFYIIPMAEMIGRGFINTGKLPGKCSVCLSPNSNHWIHNYKNRFDQFTGIKVPTISPSQSKIFDVCSIKQLKIEEHPLFLGIAIYMINDHNVVLHKRCTTSGLHYTFTFRKSPPKKASFYDKIKFLILEIAHIDKWYVIPKTALIEHGYLLTSQNSQTNLRIAAADIENHWTFGYIDRFDLLL